MTHRALSDAQLLGGARKAHVPGGGLEGLKCVELWQASQINLHFMKKTQSRKATRFVQAAFITRPTVNGNKSAQFPRR
jgi:hypothetical protein